MTLDKILVRYAKCFPLNLFQGCILLVHSSGSSVLAEFADIENVFFWASLGINGRFRRLQNLLPQKLEGFAGFAFMLCRNQIEVQKLGSLATKRFNMAKEFIRADCLAWKGFMSTNATSVPLAGIENDENEPPQWQMQNSLRQQAPPNISKFSDVCRF